MGPELVQRMPLNGTRVGSEDASKWYQSWFGGCL